jgi:predicted DNA-binding transcriptional regulator YafY
MGLNKDAQKRIKLLNQLLNKQRWDDASKLAEVANKRLAKPVSKEQIYRDIKYLREELNAPLNWKTKEFKNDDSTWVGYTKPFTLPDSALKQEDIKILNDAAEILNGMSDILGVMDIGTAILKITEEIVPTGGKRLKKVYLEGHTEVANLKILPALLKAVTNQQTLSIVYKPYKKEEPRRTYVFHPYVLREYRNRWFVIGKANGEENLKTLAIDRILDMKESTEPFVADETFDGDKYFQNLVGASPPYNQQPQKIRIRVFKETADYITTKPIHKDQIEVDDDFDDDSIIIELNLYLTYELKQTLLSYGDGVEVLEPKLLRDEIKSIIQNMSQLYDKKV